MWELIAELLPEKGDCGDLGDRESGTAQKTANLKKPETGSPLKVPGDLSDPERWGNHPDHPSPGKVIPCKGAETLGQSPQSPQSPDIEEFIDDVEERAAIMQYEAYDCYPDRQSALAAAFEDVKNVWLERIRK